MKEQTVTEEMAAASISPIRIAADKLLLNIEGREDTMLSMFWVKPHFQGLLSSMRRYTNPSAMKYVCNVASSIMS